LIKKKKIKIKKEILEDIIRAYFPLKKEEILRAAYIKIKLPIALIN
jgi:hypothetical protein